MNGFTITKMEFRKGGGRVLFAAVVDGRKKRWNIARGLFAELVKFKEVSVKAMEEDGDE